MHPFFEAQKRAVLADLRTMSGYALSERYSWAVDRVVVTALEEALAEGEPPAILPHGWSLMALGGYGRQEMCLRSDVDVQLLVPDGAGDPGLLMERFIRRLLKVGFRLGHGVRTMSEAVMLARAEPTFATAVLTARHLAGDPVATESARATVYQHLAGPGLGPLVDHVRAERLRRAERLGDTVYVLEPDLKLGIGGIRDAHLIRWLALITGRPVDRRLAFAEDWLLKVRQCLHAHVSFKSDRLSFEYQDLVAGALALSPNEEEAAVLLMRDVQRAMKVIASRARRQLELAGDRLNPPRRLPAAEAAGFLRVGERLGREDGVMPRDIAHVVEALRAVRRTALPLEAALETGLEDLARFLGDRGLPPSDDPALAELLVELLTDPGKGASLALQVAHRTGLLASFMPEFEPIIGRLQRDLYHVYTVDEHTLRAVDQLKALARGDRRDLPLATERMAAVAAVPGLIKVLAIAVFLHDVGKGYGARHHERSAELAVRIGPRLGLTEDEIDRVCLLVRHQADMPLTCLRRDLTDPRPIRRIARITGDAETLDLLFLLSIADWSSVGPQTFSPWQQTLLDTLYLRARESLESDVLFSDPGRVAARLRTELLIGELGALPEVPSGQTDPIDDFCAALPTRYFQSVSPADMRADFHLWLRYAEGEPVAVEIRSGATPEQATVVIACADSPGVLARISAGFAAARMSVLGAEIFSLAGGGVLDVFRVANPHDRLGIPRHRDALVANLVAAAEDGAMAAPAQESGFEAHHALPPIAPTVTASNEVATHHTVFDVTAGDRPGLLADLAAFFHGEGLSVALAFVATEGRVARDSFYVVDAAQQKVETALLGPLAERLRAGLEAAPAST
jgi:[protein-PII] uridylyltransferase